MRKTKILISVAIACLGLGLATGPGAFAAMNPGLPQPSIGFDKKALMQTALKLQLPFVENRGQVPDEHVLFYARTFGGTTYVTDKAEIMYFFQPQTAKSGSLDYALRHKESTGFTIKEVLVDGSASTPKGADPAQTKVNHLLRNDPSHWKRGLSTYNSVDCGDAYEGISLLLKAYGKNLEKVFSLQPGANPERIRVAVENATALKVNDNGELEIAVGKGNVKFSKPIAYQEINGKKVEVGVAYQCLNPSKLEREPAFAYGFKVAEYDKSLPLVIDPTVVFSTYLGGSGDDFGYGIALDASGNVYVSGITASNDFPTVSGPIGPPDEDDDDVFVAKFDTNGSLIYSTYLGGSRREFGGTKIAVDSAGRVIVTGETWSQDFPLVNPIQDYNYGADDMFVAKLNETGEDLLYSTYFGGE
jgi:hypothetical protein